MVTTVGSGRYIFEVDENWAREHHAAWVAELKGEPEPAPLSIDGDGHAAPEGQASHD